ncbi:MAG: hypothetical protein ABIL44_11540 [candidate division WOR-3 bacterium]
MYKEIPNFSARIINTIEDYKQFYHTRSYIVQKSDAYGYLENNREKVIELMNLCGYRKLEKFCSHRNMWNSLDRRIPRVYLETIGVDLEVLKFAVEVDRQEYESVLQLPRSPKAGTIRYMAGVYGSYKFPDNISETDAIIMLQAYSRENHFQCCINYRDVITIWIDPNGKISYTYYEPKIEIKKREVLISTGNQKVGRSFLK